MPNLCFRGIMIMPSINKKIINEDYKNGKNIFNELKKKYPSIDTFSLGTSADIKKSLLFESNMIRIGHSIFSNKGI
jgi:hypothetical protein